MEEKEKIFNETKAMLKITESALQGLEAAIDNFEKVNNDDDNDKQSRDDFVNLMKTINEKK